MFHKKFSMVRISAILPRVAFVCFLLKILKQDEDWFICMQGNAWLGWPLIKSHRIQGQEASLSNDSRLHWRWKHDPFRSQKWYLSLRASLSQSIPNEIFNQEDKRISVLYTIPSAWTLPLYVCFRALLTRLFFSHAHSDKLNWIDWKKCISMLQLWTLHP